VRPGIRCVVFDVDDTLYLERDYVRSGFQAVGERVRERFDVPDFSARAWAAFQSGARGTIFDQVIEDLGLDRAVIPSLVSVYRSHRPAIELLPDARGCLARFLGRLPVAVVTDGPIDSQRAKVAALGLGPGLAAMVFTAELGDGLGKPHPRAFQMVEQRTGCVGPEYAYVADNPAKDFEGPRSLGWATVRVRRELAMHSAVDSGPDVDMEVLDLSELDRTFAPSP
jgi:putative hydrolase of the HAD superfamily